MPYINIKVTDERLTKAQKDRLIAESTQLMVTILGKDPQTTHVVIDEIPLENWGVAGRPAISMDNPQPASS